MFKFPTRRTPISRTWKDVFTLPVQVTTGPSCYTESEGYKINLDETIASFFSKAIAGTIETELKENTASSTFRKGSSDTLIVSRGGVPEIEISLLKTLSVPDDGQEHRCPPGLGKFQMFNLLPFGGRLPASALTRGGVFVPIYGEQNYSSFSIY